MTDSKRLSFGVDADQIVIKKLCNKDFLELSMKAISSANPNRNGSWFTPESMVASIDSFKNKPILGCFHDGDFESHNGKWMKDPETEVNYWDTLTTKGEQVLGLIREGDNVEIVEKDGLSWITFTCAIWVQYSYKQVKRLIKDAIKAQKTGESAKNISVEIDIIDYERLDNGILKINKFNLVGVTILGSRNGKKVEPGIEGADLSVLEAIDHEIYEKQTDALRLAYAKLDGDTDQIKEDFSMEMENENTVVEENTVNTSIETGPIDENSAINANFDNNETTSTDVTEENSNQNVEANFENGSVQENNENTNTEETNSEDRVMNSCVEDNCDPKPDVVCDLAWMIKDCHWNKERFECTIEYYSKHEDVPGVKAIIAILKRMSLIEEMHQCELATLLAKITSGEFNPSDEEVEKYEALSTLNYEELYDTNKDLKAKFEADESEKTNYTSKIEEYEAQLQKYSNYDELVEKVHMFETERMLNEARTLIGGTNISDNRAQEIYAKVSSGELATIEAIKTAVAVAAFDTNYNVDGSMYSAPLNDVPVVNSKVGEAEKSTKKKTSWDTIKEYSGR